MPTNSGQPYSHERYIQPGGIPYMVRDAGRTFMFFGGLLTGVDILFEHSIEPKTIGAVVAGALLNKVGNHFIHRQTEVEEL